LATAPPSFSICVRSSSLGAMREDAYRRMPAASIAERWPRRLRLERVSRQFISRSTSWCPPGAAGAGTGGASVAIAA
jgi:hypothetical protein